ncbi:thioredoxin-like protein [Catenaria anguillulae PL171]|uniref:Thioredoxin-like protein n=1 Tax=Catenaria anguillulae PL171 TaxID=765915 RepID=A0A1Y2HJJ2_9FUNG|nr:thioredoxin-like protein [Catenaria anguillulae PL171]
MAQLPSRTLSRAMRVFALVAAILALVALVFTPTPALATAGDEVDDSAVIILTADNFAQKTKSGTWIVEFYAPWCPHCRKFAPKYSRWAKKALPWRESYNFHVAKVDCVAHESICDQNKVVGFPTIYAFVNGERKDEFEEEQTYKAIEQFGAAMVAKYPHPHAGSSPSHDRASDTADVDAKPASPPKKQSDGGAVTGTSGSIQLSAELKAKQAEFVKTMKERTIPDLGKYGRVVDLTADNFDEVTSRGGPWLLEFYAPWCGHCQALEGTYKTLAEKLKGKMNVARINADDQVELRQRFGIRGYPTLKLYKSGATTDYRGARTLEALEKFALASVQPSDVRHVTYSEFARLRDEHEVAVVFAYGAKASRKEWLAFLEAADSWMLPTVTGVYASVDPQFSASNAGEAVVLVYRRGYKQVPRYPTGQDAATSAGDEDDEEKKKKEANKIVYDEEAEAAKKAAAEAVKFSVAGVRKFVHDHRFPLLPELTDHNAEDIMDGTSDDDDESDASQSRRRRVVVLGILDPKTTADDKERRVLTEVADKVLRETGGRMHGVTVQSVWLNGRVWEDYIQRVYQLSAADLPRVIISVPAHEEFFAAGEDGKPIAFTTAAIYDAIEDVVKQKAGIAGHHAKLSSTSTRGRIVSWAKAGWRKVNTLSPGFLLGAVVVSVLGIWFMCCRGGSSAAAYDRLESSKFD